MQQADQADPSAEIVAAVQGLEQAGKVAMKEVESATEAATEAGAATAEVAKTAAKTTAKVVESATASAVLSLSGDEAFLGAIGGIAKNPKGTELIAYEGVLILALWAFRSWKLSKVNTLFRQMLTQAWIAVAYWLVALFAIPSFLWGEQYRIALSHFFRALLRHFLS